MLHHRLPPLDKFRLYLNSRLAGLRFSRMTDQSGAAGPFKSEHLAHSATPKSDHSEDSKDPQTYEFGHLKSVRTFIETGQTKAASEDKIHLIHEIRQHQARPKRASPYTVNGGRDDS